MMDRVQKYLLMAVVWIAVSGVMVYGCDGSISVLGFYFTSYDGRMKLTVPHDIVGWDATLTFNHSTKSLRANDAVVTKLSSKVYSLTNKNGEGVMAAGNIFYLDFTVTFNVSNLNGWSPCFQIIYDYAPTAYDSNYALAIEYSFLFYEAQRSGVLPADNRIPWRGDSSENDGSDVGLDLSGGWHDAGDHIKSGLLMSAATTMLLHGLIFFGDAYQMIGQYDEGLRQIRWPLDYFMKCHQLTDRFYAQVGSGTIDHAHWGRPEEMDEQNITRPSYVLGAGANTSGGADVMGETAAALAAGSILFRTSDPDYSNHLLKNATSLYQLAKSNEDTYNTALPEGAEFYSSSSWEDEMAHAAAWLALAHQGTSEETTYLTAAQTYLRDDSEQYMWALEWNDKRGLVNFLLYHQLQDSRFSGNLETFIGRWLPGNDVPYTPLGLAFRLEWGSNRYAANAAFLSLLAASEGINEQTYRNFAKSQIDYMLGLVDGGRSYVVGFDSASPKRAHHKAASCPLPEDDPICDWEDFNDDVDNPNTLYGALVGGPDENDLYTDRRADYKRNEVSCDYNAGYTGALAGLIHFGESS
ncbi:uncharacterized protein [Watersipora subatra]|uniref:uncharacterized protein isoform X2 n=1 Tax=Watersipora subatra TaxID=2589382 RepID=UPI00355B1C1F